MNSLNLEQMWDIIDGTADAATIEKHLQLMKKNEAYRLEFKKLEGLNTQLATMELEEPSMRFTQNVMDNILPKLQNAKKSGRSLFFFLAGMGIILLGFLALVLNINAPEGFGFTPPIDTEGLVKQVDGIVPLLSNTYLLYSFLIINCLILFNILDKRIFKPYFEKRFKHNF